VYTITINTKKVGNRMPFYHLFLVYHDEREGEQIQLHANLPSEEAVQEHILKPLQETVTWSHGDTPTLLTKLHRVYVYRSNKHYQTLRLPDGRFPDRLPAEYVLYFLEKDLVRDVTPWSDPRTQNHNVLPQKSPLNTDIFPIIDEAPAADELPPDYSINSSKLQQSDTARQWLNRLKTPKWISALSAIGTGLGFFAISVLIRWAWAIDSGLENLVTPLSLGSAWGAALVLVITHTLFDQRRSTWFHISLNTSVLITVLILGISFDFALPPHNAFLPLASYIILGSLLIIEHIVVTLTIRATLTEYTPSTRIVASALIRNALKPLSIFTIVTLLFGVLTTLFLPGNPGIQIALASTVCVMFIGVFFELIALKIKSAEMQKTESFSSTLSLPTLPPLTATSN
jgi:hypothetical protein